MNKVLVVILAIITTVSLLVFGSLTCIKKYINKDFVDSIVQELDDYDFIDEFITEYNDSNKDENFKIILNEYTDKEELAKNLIEYEKDYIFYYLLGDKRPNIEKISGTIDKAVDKFEKEKNLEINNESKESLYNYIDSELNTEFKDTDMETVKSVKVFVTSANYIFLGVSFVCLLLIGVLSKSSKTVIICAFIPCLMNFIGSLAITRLLKLLFQTELTNEIVKNIISPVQTTYILWGLICIVLSLALYSVNKKGITL